MHNGREEASEDFLDLYRSDIEVVGTGNTNYIFLPGVSVTAQRTYKTLSRRLLQRAENKVTFVNYATRFSLVSLQEDLYRLVDGGGIQNNLVALSFGARVATQILLTDPALQSRINSLTLLGPFFYLDKESKLKSLIDFSKFVPFNSVPFLGDYLAKYAICHFKYDSQFYCDGLTRDDLIAEQNFDGFKSRLQMYLDPTHPRPYLFGKIDTPTNIVWWQKDVAGECQREEIRNCFSNFTENTISGSHAQTESSAVELSQIII